MLVSGHECAESLLSWSRDSRSRKKKEVENHAKGVMKQLAVNPISGGGQGELRNMNTVAASSATLNLVSGSGLITELSHLMKQHKKLKNQNQGTGSGASTPPVNNIYFGGRGDTGNGTSNGIGNTSGTGTGVMHTEKVAIFPPSVPVQVSFSVDVASPAVDVSKMIDIENRRIRFHVMVETGMGRLGFNPTSEIDLQLVKKMSLAEKDGAPIALYGLATHMAEASSTSDFTHKQMEKFNFMLNRIRAEGIRVPTIHTDNSSALLTENLTHFNPKILLQEGGIHSEGFTRCGGGIYGQRPAFPELLPVSSLIANVRHIAVVNKGESVGYDRTWVASRNSRIATIAIGFADGLPREMKTIGAKVEINKTLFPIVGNVCMDMFMVSFLHFFRFRPPSFARSSEITCTWY